MSGDDTAVATPGVWGTVEVNEVEIPVFLGRTYEDHITAWRNVDAAVEKRHWMLGAIAVRLERATGGRPGSRNARSETAIQKFVKDLGISRQTFQRYKRTYATFAETCTTSGTRFIQQLSFKHFEVAARFFDVTERAADVIAEAFDKQWSANELGRQLTARLRREQGPKPVSLKVAYRKLQDYIETWPLAARRQAPGLLRQLARQIEGSLPPDHDLACIRDVEEFPGDAPQQVEAVP